MKKKYFIIGDIHGEADMMEEMLQNWDEETQQLVFMGDLIDRGPDNKRSVLTGMKYAKEKGLQTTNGINMMLWQGALAYKIWLGVDMPIDYVRGELFEG